MLFELISFIFYLLFLGTGYILPIILASQAYVKEDKDHMNRWLIHFFFIGVLHFTLFPINDWLGCGSIFNGTLATLVLLLPISGYHQLLIQKFEDLYGQVIVPQIENLRGMLQMRLKQLNLY